MLAIRVDANNTVATGHLMRCMSVARELLEMGEGVIFLCSDDFNANLITLSGFNYLSLDSDWNNLDAETDKLISVLKNEDIDRVLIDSYYVTPEYLGKLRKHVKIAYIDDVSAFVYPVDLLINYNINYDEFRYELIYGIQQKDSAKGTKLLLGTAYAPLRREFCNLSQKMIADNVKNILITTGGSDRYNICGSICERLCQNPLFVNINLHIAVGRMFSHKDKLAAQSEANKNIVIHENADMPGLMQLCDVGVSAGGSTVYEMCACGLPPVIFALAENQLGICRKAEPLGVALYAGKLEELNIDGLINNIEAKVISLAHGSASLRKEISAVCRQTVDGGGAARIAEELRNLR